MLRNLSQDAEQARELPTAPSHSLEENGEFKFPLGTQIGSGLNYLVRLVFT
jgi:hypothetical protein